jgi:hypothetical protein
LKSLLSATVRSVIPLPIFKRVFIVKNVTALRVFVAGVAVSFACATATANEMSHRVALGITPTLMSIPTPSGELTLGLDDITSVEVLGLTRAEADQVVATRGMSGLSAAVLPAVVGDLFGMPPVSSNWDSVRAAVAAGGFATRPTVGVDE